MLISSYEVGGGSTVQDTFQLGYAKILIEYKPVKPDGSLGPPVKAGGEVKADKKA